MHKNPMDSLTERRRLALAQLIRSHALTSQSEVADRLCELGFAATQATVSRDLEQIGAVKVRRAGQPAYALPDQLREVPAARLDRIFRDHVVTIATAGNLVVIRTQPGSAHVVGVALDQSQLPDIVGTICGDDTIFVACPTPTASAKLARSLRAQHPAVA